MKIVRNLSLALVMAFSITAAADDKKPAPAPAKDAPAAAAPAKGDVDKWLAFFDKLVDIVVADKDTCPKMATDVSAHIDANADLLKKAQEAEDKGQKLPKEAEDHMKASAQKMMGGMQKCMNDKGVQTAFSKLMTKKDKAKETK